MRNDADWVYLPLSEERVIAKQIKNRSKLDAAYFARQNTSCLLEASGSFDLAEAVLCTYIDLDRQIEACGFSPSQLFLLRRQMDGAALSDIAEMEQTSFDRVEMDFRNMVAKIARRHEKNWQAVYGEKISDRKMPEKNP